MLIGVPTNFRIVILGHVRTDPAGNIEGRLLAGKFFPPVVPSLLAGAGKHCPWILPQSWLESIARFLARGSQNDFPSEPTIKEVSEILARLAGLDDEPALTCVNSVFARGAADRGLVRLYYECGCDLFWNAKPVMEATMAFQLPRGDSRVTLVGSKSDYFLGEVARQVAESVRIYSDQRASVAA